MAGAGMGGRIAVLLLHGAGTTGAVWHGVRRELAATPGLEVYAPDLPGHGEAPPDPPYSVGRLAAAVATAVPPGASMLVAGHSLGGHVALALASGWFGMTPIAALSLGAKVEFSDAERSRLDQQAARAVRWFGSREEALERYRLVAGLPADRVPDPAYLERGVIAGDQGYRLACDPATYLLRVPDFRALLDAAACPALVVRGSQDAFLSREQCEALGAPFEELAGLGHNAQAEDPARVAALLRRLLGR
jgi:pimeloyl-ACP methyl ester carboxylesterase